MGNIYGLDLGTGNIKIFSKQGSKILNEKNIIAIQNKKELFAFGDDAFEMFEKAPANIQVSYPMVNGVVSDLRNMQSLLKCFLEKTAKGNLRGSDFFIAVPTEITEVEKRAFFDLVNTPFIKPKKVLMVEKAIADAAGMDLDVTNSKGIMVVNIGADTTEISVLSLGGIVVSRLLKTGGKKLDDCIRGAIRRKYNLNIGGKTAELLKMQLGYAAAAEDITAPIYGVNVVTGMPREIQIPAAMINEAIVDQLRMIAEEIKNIIEKTPPELAADIIREGIYVTGGSSHIRNIDLFISQEVGFKVNLTECPSESAVRGLARIMTEKTYKRLAYTLKELNEIYNN